MIKKALPGVTIEKFDGLLKRASNSTCSILFDAHKPPARFVSVNAVRHADGGKRAKPKPKPKPKPESSACSVQ